MQRMQRGAAGARAHLRDAARESEVLAVGADDALPRAAGEEDRRRDARGHGLPGQRHDGHARRERVRGGRVGVVRERVEEHVREALHLARPRPVRPRPDSCRRSAAAAQLHRGRGAREARRAPSGAVRAGRAA
jgi:hypothetical protein